MLRGTVVLGLVIGLGMALAPSPVFAQRGGGGGAASMPNNAANARAPYFSGHVTLEDGSAPAAKVIIESMCSGTIREETTVDRKGGSFGFTLGQGSGDLMLDATNQANRAGPSTSVSTRECALQAVLTGYTSDVIYLANLSPGKADVGTIVLHKASGAVAGGASDTAKQASKDARKAFDKGAEAAKGGKWSDAAASFRKAAELSPGYADAWLELGKAQVALKQVDEARKSFEASIKADQKYPAPYIQLAQIESQAQNWKGVTDVTGRLLKLAPGVSPQIYLFDAVGYFRLENLEAAESSAREGLKADTLHQAPRLHQVMASCMARRGDLAGAAAELKQYLELAPFAADAAKMKSQIEELEAQLQAAPPKP
jgi:tetratricopeptide (TPR) repeat protein